MSSLTYTLYTLLHWRMKFFLLIVHMNYFFTFWCKWRNWYCTTLHGNRFHNERREYPYNVIFVCLTETARYVMLRRINGFLKSTQKLQICFWQLFTKKNVLPLRWETENIGSAHVRRFIQWRNICATWVVSTKNKAEEKGRLFRRRGFCYNLFVPYTNFEEPVSINIIFMTSTKGFCFS